MAWQDWDRNDGSVLENETVWPFLNRAPRPTNFSSQWLPSQTAAPPVWPQTNNQTPLATTPVPLFSRPIDDSLNPFAGCFGDAAAWEDWDGWEDAENNGDDEFDGGLDTQRNLPDFTAGISPQRTLISNITSYSPRHPSSDRGSASSARNGKTYSTRTKASSPSLRSGQADNRSRAASEAFNSWPKMLSNYLDFSDREGLAGVPARVDFTAGQRPETT
jgi:hypothetical protein